MYGMVSGLSGAQFASCARMQCLFPIGKQGTKRGTDRIRVNCARMSSQNGWLSLTWLERPMPNCAVRHTSMACISTLPYSAFGIYRTLFSMFHTLSIASDVTIYLMYYSADWWTCTRSPWHRIACVYRRTVWFGLGQSSEFQTTFLTLNEVCR